MSNLASVAAANAAPSLPSVRPDLPQLQEIASQLQESLHSRMVTNGGPRVLEFERRLGQLLEVPTLAFCNGTQALLTLLLAADVRGGEVIVPSYAFANTVHAIVLAGAQPVFADIQSLDRPLLAAADVERRTGGRTPDRWPW
jgi:dTDP-4-amino-4,6-dideoxyglucose